MNAKMKLAIVVALALAAGATIFVKQRQASGNKLPPASVSTSETASVVGLATAAVTTAAARLPRLVDLGADKCVPCKMMAPILEGLKKEYAGKLQVDFIDVWKSPDAKEPYNIKIIPTQIFFDVEGKELFRHEGFFSKEDILAKWKELGFNLTP